MCISQTRRYRPKSVPLKKKNKILVKMSSCECFKGAILNWFFRDNWGKSKLHYRYKNDDVRLKTHKLCTRFGNFFCKNFIIKRQNIERNGSWKFILKIINLNGMQSSLIYYSIRQSGHKINK